MERWIRASALHIIGQLPRRGPLPLWDGRPTGEKPTKSNRATVNHLDFVSVSMDRLDTRDGVEYMERLGVGIGDSAVRLSCSIQLYRSPLKDGARTAVEWGRRTILSTCLDSMAPLSPSMLVASWILMALLLLGG